MSRILKVIEVNQPDPRHVSEILARAFINTHGVYKVKLAIEEIKKRNTKN